MDGKAIKGFGINEKRFNGFGSLGTATECKTFIFNHKKQSFTPKKAHKIFLI